MVKEEVLDRAEELAEDTLCKVKCLCPAWKAAGLCSDCNVFFGLRDYYAEQIEEGEKTVNKEKDLYEGIDENVVKLTKAIEYFSDFDNELCKASEDEEACDGCKFKNLCDARGEENVNLALHLIQDGYGDTEQAVKEFAEKLKEKFAYDVERCKTVDDLIKETYGE